MSVLPEFLRTPSGLGTPTGSNPSETPASEAPPYTHHIPCLSYWDCHPDNRQYLQRLKDQSVPSSAEGMFCFDSQPCASSFSSFSCNIMFTTLLCRKSFIKTGRQTGSPGKRLGEPCDSNLYKKST